MPIENSLEGSISVTLDLLAEESERCEIVGEALLAVRHSLIAPACRCALEQIETVITHPQVPGQCRRFLRAELAHARVQSAELDRRGGPGRRLAGSSRRGRARDPAGGGDLRRDGPAAGRPGPRRQRDPLSLDRPRGRAGSGRRRRGGGSSRVGTATSLVFWGAGAERPGWLVRCLDVFARREINLSRIESRPRRERMGNYMFFVDLHGDLADEPVAAAVEELRQTARR